MSEPLKHSNIHPKSFFKNIYLFLAVLGLCCCVGFSLVVESGGYSPVGAPGLPIAAASLVVERGLWGSQASVVAACGLTSCGSRTLEHRLNCCGARVYLLHDTWDLPRSGIEPVSPVLAGGFLTTEQPGKPPSRILTASSS